MQAVSTPLKKEEEEEIKNVFSIEKIVIKFFHYKNKNAKLSLWITTLRETCDA